MSGSKDGSATIYALNDARMRMRDGDLGDADLDAFDSAGAFLMALREQSGVALSEIAERTHIKEVYLSAIETGDKDAMPNRPFAIGFVKAYAEMMGVNAEQIVARFKHDQGYDTAAGGVEPVTEKPEPVQKSAGPQVEQRDMSLPAVIAIIAFILWCAWEITRPGEVSTPYRLDGVPTATTPVVAVPQTPAPGLPPAPEPVFIEARVIERIEPVYPRSCETGAAAVETVDVGYTVTAEGGVAGERVISSTNECFNRTSLNAVRRWRFDPRTVDGAPRPAYEQRISLSFTRPQ